MESGLFSLSGKIACVTGASSGIGRHVAAFLASCGARVVGVARREERLRDWHQHTQGETAYVGADLADAKSLVHAVKRIRECFGPPDILINAAGCNLRQSCEDVSREGWDLTIETNLSTPFFLAQNLVEDMKKKGWGRIVLITSLQSYRAFPNGVAYGASKGGVAQLTRAMAEGWSSSGVLVNAIGPGFFETELTAKVFSDKERVARNAAQTCLGRNGHLRDLDGPIQFLCSDASAYVTGQVLMVDGGFSAK